MMHVFYENNGKDITDSDNRYPPHYEGAEFDVVYPPYQSKTWRRVRFRVVRHWNPKTDSYDLFYKPISENTLSARETRKYEAKLDKVVPLKYDPIK